MHVAAEHVAAERNLIGRIGSGTRSTTAGSHRSAPRGDAAADGTRAHHGKRPDATRAETAERQNGATGATPRWPHARDDRRASTRDRP